MNKKLDFVVQAFVNYNIYARVYERFLLQIVTIKYLFHIGKASYISIVIERESILGDITS